MTDYQPISQETRTKLLFLAMRVQTDLAMAGIPVVPADGMAPFGATGAAVYVDNLEPNGVLVHWETHDLLFLAGNEVRADNIVADNPTGPNPHSAYAQVVSDTMREAMRTILTAAGWPVTDSDTGHVIELLVARKEEESPWIAWRHAQFDRHNERWMAAVNARHRQECDLHEDDDSDSGG